MPFPGSMVAAPIMASRQGMKDLAFASVSDQAQPVVRAVSGALTGKGSGLLQPVTQAAQGVAQSRLQQAAQGAGQAAEIGTSEFWAAGSSTGVMGGAGAAGGAALSVASGLFGSGTTAASSALAASTGSLGSAAAAAGSSLGSVSSAGSVGSNAASAAAQAMGGAGMASQPGITPGQRPAAPQFTALPTIPSLPRLQDVVARLGALAGPAAPLVTGPAASAGAAEDDVVQPVSQFAGSVANNAPEAASDL